MNFPIALRFITILDFNKVKGVAVFVEPQPFLIIF